MSNFAKLPATAWAVLIIALAIHAADAAEIETNKVTVIGATGSSATQPALKVTGDGGVFFQKGSASATPVSSGAGLYYYPYKAALILGGDFSASPLPSEIGNYSISISGGVASGFGALATHNGLASGYGSIAIHYGEASGFGAIATHRGEASGENSLALGIYSVTSGYGAFSAGSYSTVSGVFAFATNIYNYAMGDASAAFGEHTTAQAYGSFVIGRYNTLAGDPLTWQDGKNGSTQNDPLFVVGNGSSSSNRSDAFVVYKSGDIKISKRQGDVGMGRFGNTGDE